MSVELQAVSGGKTTQQVQIVGGSASDGALVDGADSAIKATVKDLANANPLTVAITDANGDQITSFGGGTQYTEGDTDASITGTAMLGETTGNALAPVQLDGSNNVKVAVQGTVPVSGTFWQSTQPVSLAAAVPVTDNSGSLTVDAPVGTPVFVRLSDGASAIATLPVSIAATVTTKETRAATPSQSSPSVTNSSTSILASNANRLGATIYNEGSATCYMKLGSTASTTSYTLQIASGGYYEVPFGYTGAIDGITSASTAQLRVTELTA